ncbi:uncharacterized protein LOC115224792 isoform X1 [Octopus sinensis]|uniref:Uncharacterized protein LOC115224792 isoform X1 n=1 Tax=Octopus sinensis TaxID=2607531 RepID=A0A7E6FRQ5_9MOLL|nr:uncharacterized protein LOC115224792 isoform X1 [Octopus sinensis]
MFRKKKEQLSSRQFYVQFLGWLPCTGIQGSEYTTPAITELKKRLKEHSNLPKLTLKINSEGLEVSPINDNSKKKPSNPRIFPIMLEDIMFVALECMDSDIVACIYRNRNALKAHFLQVHVYRFDSPSTASHFVQNIHFMTTTEAHLSHVRHIEDFLRREVVGNSPPIQPKSPLTGTVSSGGSSSNAASDENVPVVQEDPQVQAITDELKLKFKTKATPILLPAKDYDTVRRKQGHIDKMGTRKCRNERVVGALRSHFKDNDDDDEDDDDDDDVDDDNNDDDDGTNGQGPRSPYPLYPIRKSPASSSISPESKSPRSPELVHLRDNRHQRPGSTHGSDSGTRNSAPPSMVPPSMVPPSMVPPSMVPTSPERKISYHEQNAVFQFDKRYPQNESKNSTVSSDRSGSSRHSNPPRNPLPTMPKPKYEIPPDYDVSPQVFRYQAQLNHPGHGYYRDDLLVPNHSRGYPQGVQYPQRPYNSNMNLNMNYPQPHNDYSELYARPAPRLRSHKFSR